MPEACGVPDRFASAMASVCSEQLDCLQTTFALFADQRHGPLSHLALGSRLTFPALGSSSRPRLNNGLQQRIHQARDLLGAQFLEILTPTSSAELMTFVRSAPFCYAVADVFELCWLPTRGHDHARHSFALAVADQAIIVVDAYANVTQWGVAKPGAWRLSAGDIDALVSNGIVLHRLDLPDDRWEPAGALSAGLLGAAEASVPFFDAYVNDLIATAQDGGGGTLVLDIWSLTRERQLHSSWLSRRGLGSGREIIDRAWADLSTRAYVVLRRGARDGHARFDVLAQHLLERLYADVGELRRVHDLERPETLGQESVENIVKAVLENVCGQAGEDIESVRDLRDLPGFQSLRLVQVIDAIEEKTGIVPDFDDQRADFFSVRGLVQLFAGSPRRRDAGRR